jgi:hypothetical protein
MERSHLPDSLPLDGTSPQGAGRNAGAVPSKARDGTMSHRGLGWGC